MSFTWKVVIAFGLASAILVGVGVLSFRRIQQTDEDESWVAHTHFVREELDSSLADFTEAETNQRGYLITDDEKYLKPYQDAAHQLGQDVQNLRQLTRDNSLQQASLDQLEPLIANRLAQLQGATETHRALGSEAAIMAVRGDRGRETEKIHAIITAMLQEEDRLLAERSKAATASSRRAKFIILFGYVIAFLFLTVASITIHHEMRSLTIADQALVMHSVELEAANKELESFCYSVSHDLRAPLRGIDGFSQALLEDYGGELDDGAQEHLRRIRAAAQRMGRLIDDLLNLSRYTRAEIQKEPTDLAEIGRKVAAELRQSEPQRDAQVVIAPQLPCQGDPQLMRVVLENLLGNAWKFSSKTPQARIEFGKTDSNGSSAFYVRDNGAGFDPAYASQLFGAFQRLHGMAEFPGTGVGLATVRRIIQRHGGRIWAESAVDQGATFYFTL